MSMFEPFTPEAFRKETGMEASENEAIYIRWVNTQINYANYHHLRDMADSFRELLDRMKEPALAERKEPYRR